MDARSKRDAVKTGRSSWSSTPVVDRRGFLKLGVFGLVAATSPLAGCGYARSSSATGSRTLTVAHNLNEEHPVHRGLVRFGEELERLTGGSLGTEIYANSVVGSERDTIEQVERGGIDITKVSAGAFESFAPSYRVFSLPYIFDSQEHFYQAMELPEVRELYGSTRDDGYLGLTYFDAGARSFYSDREIVEPSDLAGMQIRIQESRTAADLIKQFGASPAPLDFGEVYTALQQGVVDGAENNETALTSSSHGEVASIFSETKHARVPDVVLVSTATWESLGEGDREALSTAAKASTDYQKGLWQKEIRSAIEEARSEMGVRFVPSDLDAMREKVRPMVESYREEDAKIRRLTDAIDQLGQGLR